MTPLNPALFHALHQFGPVGVSAPGEGLVATYLPTPDGRVWMQVVSPGEYYRVNCPFCNDTRQRLWVNHRWGVRDPRTGTRNRWLAICYNENCLSHEANRLELIEATAWYHREAGAGRVAVAGGRAEPVGRPVRLPRDYVPLDQLERGHRARRYVRQRGFNPDALARDWGIGFSREAYYLASAGRLLIPVYRVERGEPVCWGWQARALEPSDEAGSKYFTAPKMKKSQLLYGLERVDGGTGPVLVCEGAVDVWRAGRNAVALLGKYASAEQLRLLQKHLRGRPLAVALDPDAPEEAESLVRKMRQARAKSLLNPDGAPVVRVRLPAGHDPGDCDPDQLWELAERALRRAARR
jgi:hypothetical protein